MAKEHKRKHAVSHRTVISIAIVVGVAVVALGAGIFASWRLQQAGSDGSGSNSTGANSDDESGLIGFGSNPPLKAVIDAQKQSSQGSYDQAQTTLDNALKTSTSSDDKIDIYLEKGVTFENEQKYQDALDAYNQAKAIKATTAVWEAIARVQTALGNKQAAIDAYNQAINSLDPNNQRSQSQKATYQQSIKGLQ